MAINHEVSTGFERPSDEIFELAGALQAVLYDVRNRDFELSLEQEVGLAQLGGALLDGKKSGYIEMATSTGKTALESLVAEAVVKSGKRVLMLAPKIAIARQLDGRNDTATTGLAKFTNMHQGAQIGRHFGGSRARVTDDIVISTYSGFVHAAKDDFRRLGEFDVIIADECHRGLGERTSRTLLDSYPDALKLGFSATPDFAEDRKSEEVFGDRLFEFSLLDAIESGRTAPLRTLIYETDQDLELFDNRREFTERELAALIENPERNGTALSLAEEFVRDGRQGIIACIPGAVNEHARHISGLLQQRGIAASDIGSHLSDEEVARRLHSFNQGETQVLSFTRALEEGWDSQRASFAINMAPTSSPVRTKQLLGRTLRKKQDDRESVYVDFVDRRRGVHKNQYTALHALDIDTIETDRVLGRNHSGSRWNVDRPLSLPNLDETILQKLRNNNGKQLSELLVTEVSEQANPLVAQWERILEKDGLSARLTDNELLGPSYETQYSKVTRQLALEQEDEVVHEDILSALREESSIATSTKKRLASFGTKLSWESDVAEDELIAEEYDPYSSLASTMVNGLLADDEGGLGLTERERTLIRMRFGLVPYDTPHTLDQMGDELGVSRERIRQIESKTMAKLRHSSRSVLFEKYTHRGRVDGPEQKESVAHTEADVALWVRQRLALTSLSNLELMPTAYEKHVAANIAHGLPSLAVPPDSALGERDRYGPETGVRRAKKLESLRDMLSELNETFFIPDTFYEKGGLPALTTIRPRQWALRQRITFYEEQLQAIKAGSRFVYGPEVIDQIKHRKDELLDAIQLLEGLLDIRRQVGGIACKASHRKFDYR